MVFIIFTVVLGLIDGGVLLYAFCVTKYLNNSMKGFHVFLADYKQTPRSRNIRKYKPDAGLGGIMEENSKMEDTNTTILQTGNNTTIHDNIGNN